jgi:hypothetical protein
MQFINPYFLFGLILIAIPIIIHLFNFRKFKKIYFSNVRLLKEIEISTKKQNKVRNWILLLSRILAIIALVLLFAQPYFPNKEEKLVEKGLNAVVICLDNSFSMQNQGREGQLIEQGKQKAKDIIKQYNSSDEFLLLTMDMEGKHQHFVNKEMLINYLDEIEISSKTEYNSKLIKRGFDLLNNKQGFNKRLFFISDFQHLAFDVDKFPMDTTIKTLLVPIEANNISNIYIDSISFIDPVFQIGKNITLNVRIINKSDKKAEAVSVKLFLDNKQLSVSSLDIEANQSQSLIMNFVLEKHGIQHGYISLIDNPITFDDNFYFTLQTNPKIEVLSINSETSNPYISHLFSSSNSEISLTDMNEKKIDFTDFSKYSLIILNQLNEFSSGLASELTRYRERGGDILIIPSEKMNISSFQSSMQQMGLPIYSQLVLRTNKVSLINQESKLYKGVFSQQVENMEMPSAKKYFQLSYTTQTSRESIMKFQSQDDFLLVSQKDKSKVYIFATDLNDSFTDFVRQALFVPTLWNMALFSQVVPVPYYMLSENNEIDISQLSQANNLTLVQIVSIDKKTSFIPELRKSNQQQSLIIHNQIHKAGNYNIVEQDKVYAGVSFNYSRMESDLSFLDTKEISEKLKQHSLKSYNTLDTKKQLIASYFKKTDKGFSLSIIWLILLFLSITIETYILLKNR